MTLMTTNKKFVAPDGGWGWVIVAAASLSNIILIPTLQGFGLLYRNVFIELEMSATDISTIINVNSAFGLILGLFNGPLIKTLGFRKVAMVGTIFMFTGFALCSTATSFLQFIIFYGIINSMGFNVTMSSYNMALNTYWCKRRSRAVGLATAFTGFGPVLMPFLMSYLLGEYGVRGTALILSALILHSFAGALLLQPVEWHAKPCECEEKELEPLKPVEVSATKTSIEFRETPTREDCCDEEEVTEENLFGVEGAVIIPTKATENGGPYGSRMAVNNDTKSIGADPTWWRRESNAGGLHRVSVSSARGEEGKKRKPGLMKKIVEIFDFDLLKDAGYRNIWLGMSLAFTGEINFSLMTPLILGDKGMDIDQTASLMSAIAISDIVFRFISPFIGDWLKMTPKYMYMGSLVFLVLTRTGLTLVTGYQQILIACLFIGVARGLRTVYMSLVIPSYVPLEKLASASGLQTLLNGLLLISVGPALGYLRDSVGNYNVCIHVINTFSIVTIILWSVELVFIVRKRRAQRAAQGQRRSRCSL